MKYRNNNRHTKGIFYNNIDNKKENKFSGLATDDMKVKAKKQKGKPNIKIK